MVELDGKMAHPHRGNPRFARRDEYVARQTEQLCDATMIDRQDTNALGLQRDGVG